MNGFPARVRRGFGGLLGLPDVADVADVTPQITEAVTAAIREAVSQADGGPVIIVGSLTVNVQFNAAQGGGASVNVKN